MDRDGVGGSPTFYVLFTNRKIVAKVIESVPVVCCVKFREKFFRWIVTISHELEAVLNYNTVARKSISVLMACVCKEDVEAWCEVL